MNLLKLLILLIVSTSFMYSNDNNLSLNTSKKLHDTISILKIKPSKVFAYFFIDKVSCETCLESMKNISRFLEKEFDAEIITFINADADFDTVRFRKNIDWKYPFILDYIGAYKSHFGILNFPVMFLADYNGCLEYIGIPGSAKYFDANLIHEKALEIQNRFNLVPEISGLEFLDKKNILNNDKKQIKISEPFSGYILPDNNGFILSSLNNNNVFVVDSNCILTNEYQLDNFNIERHSLVHGNNDINNIFVYSVDLEPNGPIYKINIKDGTCESVLTCNTDLKDNTSNWFSVRKLSDSVFLINQALFSPKKSNGLEPSIKSYTIGQNKLKVNKIGRFNSNYLQFFLQNYFGSDICLDKNNNIYEYQNFSDSIYYHDLNKNITVSYPINFDTNYYFINWKSAFKNIDETTDLEIRKSLRYKISNLKYGDAIKYDKIKDEILIFYGHKDQNTDKQILHLKRFNKDCLDCKNTDIKIPSDCIVLGVNNGIITFLRTLNDLSYIFNYKFVE